MGTGFGRAVRITAAIGFALIVLLATIAVVGAQMDEHAKTVDQLEQR